MQLLALALALLPQQKPADPDTTQYSALLGKYVAQGQVDYDGLRKDRAALDLYLKAAADTRGEHGLAFWINVYNASVIRDLVDSGTKLPARVIDLKGFFDKQKHKVNSAEQTLSELESFVRKQWKDPRVHFALNCGARSCPPLPARAFSEEQLGETLDGLTRAFLDGPGLVFDEETRELRVTKLCEWYKDDFVAKDGSLEGFLRRYVKDAKKLAALDPKSGRKLVFQSYDWTPNAKR